MPEIPLSQGQVAIVDDVDYEFLMQWKWYADKCRGGYRAKRNVDRGGKWTTQYMHRAIAERMGVDSPTIDHRDRNQLNNQRLNLRAATGSQQQHNQGIRVNNKSGYPGVCWNKRAGKWKARIQHLGVDYHLGYFDDPKVAYEAYKKKKRELAGEFTPEEIKDA